MIIGIFTAMEMHHNLYFKKNSHYAKSHQRQKRKRKRHRNQGTKPPLTGKSQEKKNSNKNSKGKEKDEAGDVNGKQKAPFDVDVWYVERWNWLFWIAMVQRKWRIRELRGIDDYNEYENGREYEFGEYEDVDDCDVFEEFGMDAEGDKLHVLALEDVGDGEYSTEYEEADDAEDENQHPPHIFDY